MKQKKSKAPASSMKVESDHGRLLLSIEENHDLGLPVCLDLVNRETGESLGVYLTAAQALAVASVLNGIAQREMNGLFGLRAATMDEEDIVAKFLAYQRG